MYLNTLSIISNQSLKTRKKKTAMRYSSESKNWRNMFQQLYKGQQICTDK